MSQRVKDYILIGFMLLLGLSLPFSILVTLNAVVLRERLF